MQCLSHYLVLYLACISISKSLPNVIIKTNIFFILPDLENSPSHQGGSDLPLYDPPPSYEEVIKLYLPPPPPYSSVNRGRTRPNSRPRSGGVDNRGYRNDSPNNGARVHTRRSRTAQGRQDSTRPMVLKVALPEEEPTRNRYESASSVLSCLMEQDADSPIQTSSADGGGEVNDANSSLMGLLDGVARGSRPEPETPESCDCEGACSCKLIGKRKQVILAQCDGKTASNLLLDKAAVSKKRSFRDMMQKSMGRGGGSSSSAIIPHPASMTITMHPPRTKKGEKDSHANSSSKSGPSSPKSTDSPPPEYSEDLESGHSSKFYYGHRRSSSGPSLPSPDNLTEVSKSSPSSSETQASQVKHLASVSSSSETQAIQVKHPASALLDGSQSSFSFKSEEILPEVATTKGDVNWTLNLLVPEGSQKSEKTWTGSDTHPLILNGSQQQPSIVKFDDESAPSSQNQIFQGD